MRKRKNANAVALGRRRMRKLKKSERTELTTAAGKASAQARFAGMSRAEISAAMRALRAKANPPK